MANVRENILTNSNYMIYFRCLGILSNDIDSLSLQEIQEVMDEEFKISKSIGIIHRQIKVLVNEEKLLIEEKKNKILHYSINYEKLNKLFLEYLYETLKDYSERDLIFILDLFKKKNNLETFRKKIDRFYKNYILDISKNPYLTTLFGVMLPMTYENCLKDFFNLIINYFELGKFGELKVNQGDLKLDSEVDFFLDLEDIFSIFTPYNDFDRLDSFFENLLLEEFKKSSK